MYPTHMHNSADSAFSNGLESHTPLSEFQRVAETGYGHESNVALTSFWQILHLLRKWWWLIAIISIAITSYTAFKLSQITPMYSSNTTLEVKQQARNIVGSAIDSSVENVSANKEFFTTQIELLKSDTLAEDVILTLNLMSDTDFVNLDAESNTALPREKKLSGAVGVYKSRLKVVPVNRSRLIELYFEHSNPEKAALVANTVVQRYINNSLERKFNASAYAREFLEGRLATVKTSLELAERELVEYASENDILIINNADKNDASSSLNKANLIMLDSELTSARNDLVRAQQAFENLGQNNFVLEVLENTALSQLKEQKMVLESDYNEDLARYKPNHPEMLELKSRIELIDTSINSETAKIVNANREKVRLEYTLAKAREADLARRVLALKNDVVDLRERSIEYTILKREVDTERSQYDALLQRLKEVTVSEDVGSNLVEIVDEAKPARSPYKPNKRRTLILALLLSTAIGFALAYAIELIDDRIKQPEDIKNKLGKTALGVVPQVKDKDRLQELLTDPQEAIAEAYATLRSNLQYSAIDGGPRIIQITSTQPGEGKSVSSMGLAIRFAGLGEKTLLIDADMRRPTFKNDDQNALGLSGLLTSRVNIGDHIKTSGISNLSYITSGEAVPNPSEILSSERFKEILAYARKHYAYIIVDSPPVIGLADAPVIGANVDATVLVVEANNLRINNIKSAMDRLSMSGTRILGVVMTKYNAQSEGYSYYRYSYGKHAASYDASKQKNPSKVKPKQKFNLG